MEVGLPTLRNEDWRYTSLRPFLEHHFEPCEEDFTALELQDIDDLLLPDLPQNNAAIAFPLPGSFLPQSSAPVILKYAYSPYDSELIS